MFTASTALGSMDPFLLANGKFVCGVKGFSAPSLYFVCSRFRGNRSWRVWTGWAELIPLVVGDSVGIGLHTALDRLTVAAVDMRSVKCGLVFAKIF